MVGLDPTHRAGLGMSYMVSDWAFRAEGLDVISLASWISGP